MSEERKCPRCGGSGPFPDVGRICKACHAKRKAAWHQKRKANGWKQKRGKRKQKFQSRAAYQRDWRKRDPGKTRKYHQNYEAKQQSVSHTAQGREPGK